MNIALCLKAYSTLSIGFMAGVPYPLYSRAKGGGIPSYPYLKNKYFPSYYKMASTVVDLGIQNRKTIVLQKNTNHYTNGKGYDRLNMRNAIGTTTLLLQREHWEFGFL